jgi:hypothetical protein
MFLDGGRNWGSTLKLSGTRNVLAREQALARHMAQGEGAGSSSGWLSGPRSGDEERDAERPSNARRNKAASDV